MVNYLNVTHLTILSLLFIRFQEVRELHMFEYPSSDHTIPSSSSVPRMYVNLINCSSTTHLTIVSLLFIGLQIVSELGWLSEDLSSDHPITFPLSVSREYAWSIVQRSLVWSSHSHPLHSSSECTWTWSHVIIPLIWLSYPICTIRIQAVRELFNCLSTTYLTILSLLFVRHQEVRELGHMLEYNPWLVVLSHSLPPSSGCSWTLWIVCIPLIWPSYPSSFKKNPDRA